MTNWPLPAVGEHEDVAAKLLVEDIGNRQTMTHIACICLNNSNNHPNAKDMYNKKTLNNSR